MYLHKPQDFVVKYAICKTNIWGEAKYIAVEEENVTIKKSGENIGLSKRSENVRRNNDETNVGRDIQYN